MQRYEPKVRDWDKRIILIDGKPLEDDYLEVIPTTRYPKGEYFYDIPIHLTKFIDLT